MRALELDRRVLPRHRRVAIHGTVTSEILPRLVLLGPGIFDGNLRLVEARKPAAIVVTHRVFPLSLLDLSSRTHLIHVAVPGGFNLAASDPKNRMVLDHCKHHRIRGKFLLPGHSLCTECT